MAVLFQPEYAGIGALSALTQGDTLYAVYRREWDHFWAQGRVDGLWLLSTTDGLHFNERPLHINAESGCMVCNNGIYHLFYLCHDAQGDHVYHRQSTAVDDPAPATAILHAPANVSPAKAWRDPWVWYDEQDDQWHLILGAANSTHAGRQGCIAESTSADLEVWSPVRYVWEPGSLSAAPACPSCFTMGDFEYLFFTSMADEVGVQYRFRRKGQDAWQLPPISSLDSPAFRYARPVRWHDAFCLCGVIPTRERNLWHFQPASYQGSDFTTWDEGGTLIMHQMHARSDGVLTLDAPCFLKESFSLRNELLLQPINGSWSMQNGSWTVDASADYAQLISRNDVPDECCLTLRAACSSDTRRVALAVQVDRDFAEGYYFYWEPCLGRVQLRSAFRMSEEGSWRFPYEVEAETFLLPGDPFTAEFRLLFAHGIMILYVNGESALCARYSDYTKRSFGLAVENGQCTFSHLSLSTPTPAFMRIEGR